MAIVYQNGTVVSVPVNPFQSKVERASMPVDKCFGLSFKTKMKIFDAAHVQHLEMSNAMRFHDPDTGEVYNPDINHVFLTPTFDLKNPASYMGISANESIKRFTDNLSKRYGASSYVWVKEFTKELVPHYHMLVTMPYTPIAKLNRAWSHARGDIDTVNNALRTGWNPKTRKPTMKVASYKAAVGYAAKYISKGGGGDLSVLRTSCRVADRQTWEARTGHSTKCYGMSQNLHREPRQMDIWMELAMKPWLKKCYKFVKNDNCELFFFDDYRDANTIYRDALKFPQCKPQKVAEVIPKKSNYSVFDQLSLKI